MDTKFLLKTTMILVTSAVLSSAQSPAPRENPLDRLHRMTEAEAIGYVNSVLDMGVPDEEHADGLYSLSVSRSSLILPIIAARIERLLKAPFPMDLYTNKAVSPEFVITFLTREIETAANQEALRQAGRLLKIDAKRFDGMVERTLDAAIPHRPFVAVYEGLDIGDPALDTRIIAWVERKRIDEKETDGDMKHCWADAMAERYGAEPTAEQWAKDPLMLRLKPAVAESMRVDVLRLAAEAWKKRSRR